MRHSLLISHHSSLITQHYIVRPRCDPAAFGELVRSVLAAPPPTVVAAAAAAAAAAGGAAGGEEAALARLRERLGGAFCVASGAHALRRRRRRRRDRYAGSPSRFRRTPHRSRVSRAASAQARSSGS